MNQILITNDYNYYDNNISVFKKNRKKYLIVFLLSITICIIILFYLLYSYFSKLAQKKKTDSIKKIYNVSTLYNQNSRQNYSALKLSNEISIIGLIEIPSINLSYPIFSNSNDNLLKISVCRFSGPLPNQTGNLCIAGHNYRNSLMFSKLYKLKKLDSIYITDLNNSKLEYIIYDTFKVKENNLDCTSNTFNKEITLITCNDNNNKERIVVKAKVKE